MNKMVFSIARDFSPNPGPRYVRQGANSGEALRKRLMVALRAATGEVLVDLDGTKGMGSSFLDEAFGGLIRQEGLDRGTLLNKLQFMSVIEPSYIDEIRDSIDRARP